MTKHWNGEGPGVSAEAAQHGIPTENHLAPADPRTGPLFTLAAAGYELIPLDGKAPVGKGWTSAPPLAAEAAAARLAGGRNVGVRLRDTQVVVDWDPRDPEATPDGLDRFMTDFGLDTHPHVETGGGGVHLYLTVPAGLGVKNATKWRPGIDIKTVGGQVVAPGSIHPETGLPYVLHGDPLDDRVAQPAPSALIEALPKHVAAEGPVSVAGKHTPDELEDMLEHLDPVDYASNDAWLSLAMSCHHATAGAGEDVFIAWSLGDSTYTPNEDVSRRRWRSMRSNPGLRAITEKTLYKELSRVGANSAIRRSLEVEPVAEVPDNATLEWFRQRDYSLNGNGHIRDTLVNARRVIEDMDLNPRWDDLAQRVMMLGAFPFPGFEREYGDNLLHVLRMRIASHPAFRAMQYIPSKENLDDAIMALALERKFNPVLDYLDRLEWDGVPRVERLFSVYFSGADDEYTRAIARCFMVGAVRRQRQPGCKFDTVPILRSDQGREKSSGVKALFGADFFTDAPMDPSDKDSAMKLSGNWVVELGELEALRKSDVAAVRRFLSTDTDNYRAPYARRTQKMPRRCVFFGTANESGYLKDMTGNRRFWPIEVEGQVDVPAILRDRDQLWAEAARLEADGASATLPRHLWGVAAERQAEETTVDPLVDCLRQFLDERAEGEFPDVVHTSELFSVLPIRFSTAEAQRVRVLMVGVLGWKYVGNVRIGGRQGNGYRKKG